MGRAVAYLTAACGPSQQMSKAVNAAVKEKKIDKGLVEIVVIESDPARVKDQGILGVPTIQILDDNDKVIKTWVGYNTNIINMIKEVVNGNS